MRARPGTRNLLSYTLSILLLVAIAGFAILVGLQLRTEKPPRFGVGAPEGVECPVGEGAPACFTFTVTNLGTRPSHVECYVAGNSGSATFLTDSTIYTSSAPFEPGITAQLTVKVYPSDQNTVTEPRLGCIAV
jgi:hypothetical protein